MITNTRVLLMQVVGAISIGIVLLVLLIDHQRTPVGIKKRDVGRSAASCPTNITTNLDRSHNATHHKERRMPIRQLTAVEEEHFEDRGRILVEAMINPTIDETNEGNVDNNLRTTSGWSMQSLGAHSTLINFDPLRGLQAPEETRRQLHPSRRTASVGQSWTNTARGFKYDILVDPAYRIIIGADGYGPSGWNGGDHKPAVPEVQSNDPRDVLCWSDMAYLMYAYAIGVPANEFQIENGHYSFVAPPEWVYLPAASASRQTLEVIHTVLGTHANNPLPTKAGLTFPIGSRAYNILLGSPMLSNVASFLLDHKYRFGAAAVTSITFWDSYKRTADGTPIPDILIYVQSVDASLITALKANSAVDAAWTTCGAPLAEHRYAWTFSPRWQRL